MSYPFVNKIVFQKISTLTPNSQWWTDSTQYGKSVSGIGICTKACFKRQRVPGRDLQGNLHTSKNHSKDTFITFLPINDNKEHLLFVLQEANRCITFCTLLHAKPFYSNYFSIVSKAHFNSDIKGFRHKIFKGGFLLRGIEL